jgi:hypothetical protein
MPKHQSEYRDWLDELEGHGEPWWSHPLIWWPSWAILALTPLAWLFWRWTR